MLGRRVRAQPDCDGIHEQQLSVQRRARRREALPLLCGARRWSALAFFLLRPHTSLVNFFIFVYLKVRP